MLWKESGCFDVQVCDLSACHGAGAKNRTDLKKHKGNKFQGFSG